MLELKDVSGSALIEFFNEIFSKDKLTGFISAENPEAGISSKIFLEKGIFKNIKKYMVIKSNRFEN